MYTHSSPCTCGAENTTLYRATIYVDDFRAMVYPATSFPQDLKGWWYGVSGRISSLHEQLNVVRVVLVVSCFLLIWA